MQYAHPNLYSQRSSVFLSLPSHFHPVAVPWNLNKAFCSIDRASKGDRIIYSYSYISTAKITPRLATETKPPFADHPIAVFVVGCAADALLEGDPLVSDALTIVVMPVAMKGPVIVAVEFWPVFPVVMPVAEALNLAVLVLVAEALLVLVLLVDITVPIKESCAETV
jgi:hypothetical protein